MKWMTIVCRQVFVDADSDIRLSRRLLRDIKVRGRNLKSVLEQVNTKGFKSLMKKMKDNKNLIVMIHS
jgi:uridine kinase